MDLSMGLRIKKNIKVQDWTPKEIATSLWLDASNLTSISESSGSVSQWSDISGNDNHAVQVNSSNQPVTNTTTLNNLNVISFGVTEFMDLTSNASVQAMICVIKELDDSVTVNPVFTNSADNKHTFINTGVGLTYDISIDGSVGTTGNAGINGEPLVAGTNIDLGGSEAGNKGSNIWYTDYSSVITDAKQICKGASLNYLDGDLAEFMFLSSTPSESTRQRLEGYLAHKWGLTGNLPSDHPYKNNAPTK